VDDKNEQIHSICFTREEIHIPDSILVSCKYCNEEVWLELGEVDKVPSCISCATALIVSNKIRISTQFKKHDLKKLFQFLLEKRREEVEHEMSKQYAKEIREVIEDGKKLVAVEFQDGTFWIPKAKDLAIIISMIGKNEDDRYPMGMGHLLIKNFINDSFGKTPEEIVELYNMKYSKGA
jgi:hypothetical protein